MGAFKYYLFLLLFEVYLVTAHYETMYLEDVCSSDFVGILNLGSGNSNSSGILKISRNNSFLPGKNCTVLVQPPLGYGVILSVRHLDFRPHYKPSCKSYIEVHDRIKKIKLCGYSDDMSEYQSYTSEGQALQLNFYTEDSSERNLHSEVTFIVTSYVSVDYNCERMMFACETSHCIWRGLLCDGHNNCGDRSDEFSHRANCGTLAPGVIAGIVVGSVIVFLLLIVVPLACCRCGNKYRNQRNTPPLLQAGSDNDSSINTTEVPSEASGSNYTRYHDLPPAYKP